MARKRKDFAVRDASGQPTDLETYRESPWRQTYNGVTFDFRRWLYVGRPELDPDGNGTDLIDAGRQEIVVALRDAVWHLDNRREQTRKAYCIDGLTPFFNYLDCRSSQPAASAVAPGAETTAASIVITRLEQIDRLLLEGYIHWLRYGRRAETESGRLSYNSARIKYSAVKSLLGYLVRRQILRREIFPQNPFPHVGRSMQPRQAYAKTVMRQLLSALARDLKALHGGTLKLSGSQTMIVYLLILAARTGRSPDSIRTLSRNAVVPHPLKPAEMGLLVTHKHRGTTTSVQAFELSTGGRQIEDSVAISMDTVSVFHEICRLTAPLAQCAPPELRDRVFLYRRRGGRCGPSGDVVGMTESSCYQALQSFVQRHGLAGDGGEPLRLNLARLRKTFAQRVWELTDGDPIKTAALLGNTPQVADRHYIAVTPEMVSKHRCLGHLLHAELTGLARDQGDEAQKRLAQLSRETGVPIGQLPSILDGTYNTGVGRCADPVNGQYAPHDGSLCTSWLTCFGCRDQVVMESDLYRLYSFYYLIEGEKAYMDPERWQAIYAPVLDVIDREIVEPNLRVQGNPHGCFSPLAAERHRERARRDPHPMWRDRGVLQLRGLDETN